MKLFQPIVAKGYEWINPVHDQDYDRFLGLDGSPRAADWVPIEVRRVRADKRQRMLASDFPWLGDHALVLRRSAADALRDVIADQAEFLPLRDAEGVELFVLNVRTLDALDERGSVLWRFPGTNRIMHVVTPAFFKDQVVSRDIFRLPHRAGSIYVGERFVERIRATGLRGLDFPEVWAA